jgi:N-acetylmuramoyl-L-alanine amidase
MAELEDMYRRPSHREFPSPFAWVVAQRWYRVRVFWYTLDKEPLAFALVIGLIVTMFGFALQAIFAHHDDKRNLARVEDRRNLTCLAQNVYYEARGEPTAGQLAVAHVTMNRKASGRFSSSVCGVVYEKRWDPIRNRYVGAFSWTEFDALPMPTGEEWQRAWRVAEAVYYGRETRSLEGALFYHATYIEPAWAKQKRQVARIGNHVFYR